MPQTNIRSFIALDIQNEIKDSICEIQNRIKKTNAVKGSWVNKDNLHLTLKFLGDTQIQKIDSIKNCIQENLEGIKKINCNLKGLGVFPNLQSGRILWIGIEKGNDIIIDLAEKLDNSLLKLHFTKEKRGFYSHITICRIKQISNPKLFDWTIQEINKNFQPLEFIIDKLIFFESKLTPQGPIYTPLHVLNLK